MNIDLVKIKKCNFNIAIKLIEKGCKIKILKKKSNNSKKLRVQLQLI